MTQHSSAVEQFDESDILEVEEVVDTHDVPELELEEEAEAQASSNESGEPEYSSPHANDHNSQSNQSKVVEISKTEADSLDLTQHENKSTSLAQSAPNELSTEEASEKQSPIQTAEQQFATAVHYINVENNHYLGAKWFRKAGMQGHAKAQMYLGLMFIKGEGVPKSLFHAYCWLTLASCQNLETAKEARKNLEPYLTAAEINASLRLAAERIEHIFSI
ncbi:sel1 repeat family protein [Paraneptunicella aestuarii]|uniref:tetratricopeptide repeat protein n=1 Tax=Paraneptunicella aestuarii TaxID=2831148 RepID=UPI001E4016C4|nr:hypothetical protein [Paraneptunicella aestuarii]UAA40300.1 sel1 repeat family protein [Paraneptunicella aestuarii]